MGEPRRAGELRRRDLEAQGRAVHHAALQRARAGALGRGACAAHARAHRSLRRRLVSDAEALTAGLQRRSHAHPRGSAVRRGATSRSSSPHCRSSSCSGRDRRSALAEVVRVPAAAAMSLLLPGRVWRKHGLRHPLGEDFEGFPEFVPEEVTPAQIEQARRQVTPELLGDGVVRRQHRRSASPTCARWSTPACVTS